MAKNRNIGRWTGFSNEINQQMESFSLKIKNMEKRFPNAYNLDES